MLRLRGASAHLRRLVAPHPSSAPPAPSGGGGITRFMADLRNGPSSWSGETHFLSIVELRRGFSSWPEHRAVHQERPCSSPSAAFASGGFTGRRGISSSSPSAASGGGFTGRRGISSWSGATNLPCPCCGRSFPEVSAGHIARGSTHIIYDTPPSVLSGPEILIPQKKVILPTKMMLDDSQPYDLNYESPIPHFKKKPLLLKVAPDPTNRLYMLLPSNPTVPWMLSESGKFSLHSLRDLVISSHDKGICLGRALRLENLSISSIGTFKLNDVSEVGWVQFDEVGQIADFSALHLVMTTLLKSLHGNTIMGSLPVDFDSFLSSLVTVVNLNAELYVIKNHPALLPACTYALAFMKMYGFFMEEGCGMMYTDENLATKLIGGGPYQVQGDPTNDWVEMARNDQWLSKWLAFRKYNVKVERHILIFPRNVFSHPLGFRHATATTNPQHPQRPKSFIGILPGPPTPYRAEAVYLLFQHVFPRLLPHLLKVAYDECLQHGKQEEIDSWCFNELFAGASPCFVR